MSETQTKPSGATRPTTSPEAASETGALLPTEKLVKEYSPPGGQRRVDQGRRRRDRRPARPQRRGQDDHLQHGGRRGQARRGRRQISGPGRHRLPMHQRARLGIGYLTQEPSVFRKLTVEQNILAILETCRMRPRSGPSAEVLLDELDLARLAKSKAYTLSGGEKRRLEITRALVTSPKLLLLDEPFSGMDPIAVYEVQKIVRRLRERGLGILITDHNVRETLKLVDRAYLIHKGEVVYEGRRRKWSNDPKAREIYLGPEFNM